WRRRASERRRWWCPGLPSAPSWDDLERHLDEVAAGVVPAESACLAGRAGIRHDEIRDVGIGRLVVEEGTRAVLAREVGAAAGVRVVEDGETGARLLARAQGREQLLRLGRVRRGGVARVGLRVGGVEPALDVGEAMDDVAS